MAMVVIVNRHRSTPSPPTAIVDGRRLLLFLWWIEDLVFVLIPQYSLFSFKN
jgi:hypothetical protein